MNEEGIGKDFVDTEKTNHMYPSNLTDSQWEVIKTLLDDKRKRKYALRDIVDAILYIIRTGCQWRMLPKDFAPWKTVYYYFDKWKKDGAIDLIHDRLVEKIRIKQGKKLQPTAGIIDSQSIKSTMVAGEQRGFDAGKKIKGRKRHIIVDTLGLIMAIAVHSADIQDRDGARLVLERLRYGYGRLKVIFADAGYSGELVSYVKQSFGWLLTIVKKVSATFRILPKRWIVERTFAWINTDRRHSKDYERLTSSSEAMVQLSMIRIMLKKI